MLPKLSYVFFTLALSFSMSGKVPKKLGPCQPQIEQTQDCIPCDLQQWAKKIATLKERPIQFSTLPKKGEYQKNILTLKEFLSTLQDCATSIAHSCKDEKLWLNKKSLYARARELFTLERACTEPLDTPANFPFKPYTMRLQLKPGAVCVLFGDLHGSIHSLMRDLLKLHDLGYLDTTFKIKKQDVRIIFLGDYIDRGIYGVEVMYTIARLKKANPTQVILIRGNHEDYILAPDFRKKHTKEEEKESTPSFIDELYHKFDLEKKDEATIFRLYELLPQALYLGCGTPWHHDYMMCCHGGLELGYDPSALLHADKAVQFELITTFCRKKNFTHKITKDLQNAIKVSFDLDTLCSDIQDFVPEAPFFHITPSHKVYSGFMWNDFYVDSFKVVGQRGKKFTGWVYGKQLTQALLNWSASPKVTLQGIFRAHQHNNETGGPMLNLLCCTKGIVNLWESNRIFTLVSAPDSKLEDTGQQCFTYDSFVLVTTAARFKDWRMVHYTQDTGMPKKAWKATKLLPQYRKQKTLDLPAATCL